LVTFLNPLWKQLAAQEKAVRAKQNEIERHQITGTVYRHVCKAESFASVRSAFINTQKTDLRKSFAAVVQARITRELLKHKRRRLLRSVFTWVFTCVKLCLLIAVLLGLLWLCSRSG
jgi:hypothetical protein